MSYPVSKLTTHPAQRGWLRFFAVLVATVLFGGFLAGNLMAADGAHGDAVHDDHEGGHHGLTEYAVPLYYGIGGDAATGKVGALAVTNSMVVTWLVALAVILFAQYATRVVKQVPEGAQNFWEWLVESLHDFLENIIGSALVKKTFWFFATIFIFILFTNWAGLIPGVGTIGWGVPNAQGGFDHLVKPLFRGTNADLNMTLAMAMIFFACWTWWALQANGPGGFIKHIFGPKGHTEGFMKVMMFVVFALVGVLEVVSIIFRPVSLSFRLYGNIFAGENMLESMAMLVPSLSWVGSPGTELEFAL